jgi:hypothetical protein
VKAFKIAASSGEWGIVCDLVEERLFPGTNQNRGLSNAAE